MAVVAEWVMCKGEYRQGGKTRIRPSTERAMEQQMGRRGQAGEDMIYLAVTTAKRTVPHH